MASAFHQWEKDPFFYAAEEVQESSDRMESVYRRWMNEKKGFELRRELRIALGTVKWQLEELERAVREDDEVVSAREATVTRHKDFVEAISNRIGIVEKTLKELNVDEDAESGMIWAKMDKGEGDEFALFLSCRFSEEEEEEEIGNNFPSGEKNQYRTDCGFAEVPVLADTDSTMESSSKPKSWYRNGFMKFKDLSQKEMKESLPLSRGLNGCYERSKRCLSDCTDESCHKYRHEWFGAFQRQLQRSQYQIQYGRTVQMMIWITVTVLLLFLFVLRAS